MKISSTTNPKVNPLKQRELSQDPSSLADTGFAYQNDVAGVTELMHLNSDNQEVQITSAGVLNGAAVGFGAGAANRVVVTTGAGLATTDAQLTYDTATDVLDLTGSLRLSSDTQLSRGAANRLDLAAGDALNLIAGDLQANAGASDLVINCAGLLPDANDAYALGVGGTGFSDLFLASGGVVNFANGGTTISGDANTLTLGGATLVDVQAGIFELNDAVRFDTGVAIVAASYSVGRDADGTNQLHLNVPTGATFEFSVNDVAEMTLSATAVDFQSNSITTTGGGSLTGTWTNLGTVTTIDINGGSLDGATIGAAAASTIIGTTIDATTDFTIGGTVVTDGVITDTGVFVITPASSLSLGSGEAGTVAATGMTFRSPDITTGGLGNIAGSDLTISAGLGTGTGDEGTIIFQLPIQAGAGDFIQTRAARLTLDMAGSSTALTMQGAQDVFLRASVGNDVRLGDDADIAFFDGGANGGIGGIGLGQAAQNGVMVAAGWNAYTMAAATTAARHFQTGGNVTELANATITDIVGAYFNTFTVTDGAGTETVGILSTVYIPSAPTAGSTPTNGPYSLFVDAGTTRLDGILQQNDAIYFTQTDGNEKIDSAADGYLDYTTTTAHRFNMSAADTDTRLEFVGTTNSGLLEWMEDEDYFRFGDTILVNAGLKTALVTKVAGDSPYTVLAADHTIICNCAAGAITVNLPAVASSTGRILVVKKIDASANAVTIDGNGAETIDDAATRAVSSQYESVTLQCDGSEWWVI